MRKVGGFSFLFTITCIAIWPRCAHTENKFNLNSYNSYDNIIEYLKHIQSTHKSISTLEKVGKTYEGRDLYIMKISSNVTKGNPIIFMDANIHAREWASSAVALNLITELVRSPRMIMSLDWYIMPMVNPDGYEYSRTPGNRLWRKNRSMDSSSSCVGVDLNRNFDVLWGEIGSSSDPCDINSFCGPKAFSENETLAIRNVFIENSNNIKMYITLHTYSQLILHPYGFTKKKIPKNFSSLKILGRKMAKAIFEVSGNYYMTISAGELYEASGGSDDYAYEVMKVPYVYAFEMTKYSFEYPESKLPILYKEMTAAFKVAAKYIGRRKKLI